jgi:uncharacterized DUF497 family protein
MDVPSTFIWDTAKEAATIAERRLSFAYAARVFADPSSVQADTVRPQDGERRRKAIGMIDGRLFTVVYVMRAEACRIISARRANKQEERIYSDGNDEVSA